MDNALMEVPRCPKHRVPMVYHPAGTPEQQRCGAWYDCHVYGCACTTLIPSPEIQAICVKKEAHNE